MGKTYTTDYNMIDFLKKIVSQRKNVKGSGLLNTAINKLPIELHLPGYQYCGPGTKLKSRLASGDPGINSLDQACKEHDISYSRFKNTSDRHIADRILSEKAWQRVKAKDSSIAERANALLVTSLMKGKLKMGMGMDAKKRKVKNLTFKKAIQNVNKTLRKKKPSNMNKAITIALSSAKKVFLDPNNKQNNTRIKTPRVISIPKIGGVLPLIPIFAGLSALGAITGGASSIAKFLNDAHSAKINLEEKKRHNQKMESIALGNGLHLKPYRKGFGLYLRHQSKNL